jgi:hypothetical protein
MYYINPTEANNRSENIMQHKHDETFNILTNTLACIKTMSKSSQKYAKLKVYGIVGETERKKNKKLSEMSKVEVNNLQENIYESIC